MVMEDSSLIAIMLRNLDSIHNKWACCLLALKVGQCKLFNIEVTFDVLLKSLKANLAEYRCVISGLLISQARCGDQKVEAYSRMGHVYMCSIYSKLTWLRVGIELRFSAGKLW